MELINKATTPTLYTLDLVFTTITARAPQIIILLPPRLLLSVRPRFWALMHLLPPILIRM